MLPKRHSPLDSFIMGLAIWFRQLSPEDFNRWYEDQVRHFTWSLEHEEDYPNYPDYANSQWLAALAIKMRLDPRKVIE